MKVYLDNIGIIQDSTVLLEGLTVVTGKNNSGKTTIGKVLHSVIHAGSDIKGAFEKSAEGYLASKLTKVRDVLFGEHNTNLHFMKTLTSLNGMSNKEKVLYVISGKYSRSLTLEALLSWFDYIMDTLPWIKLDDMNSFLEKFAGVNKAMIMVENFSKNKSSMPDRGFEKQRDDAMDICTAAIDTIKSPGTFERFRKVRIMDFLNLEFHNQILPVRASGDGKGVIRMTSSSGEILSLGIQSGSNYSFGEKSSFAFPYGRAIFIDDPFVLDYIEPTESYIDLFQELFPRRHHDGENIASKDFSSCQEQLIRMVRTKSSDNFFDDMEFQNRYRDIIKAINSIVPGEFQESDDGMFYVDKGARLNVQNLATGSKMFFIIKMLFMNGYLDDSTLLILDEPESHLHPEWINKFAEILVLLIKNVKVHVLLTTHSPNLLLALNVFAKSYNVSGQSHFYLAECKEGSWAASLRQIDHDINEGYAHLSIPFIQMTIKQEELSD